jgi:hypothetical protein
VLGCKTEAKGITLFSEESFELLKKHPVLTKFLAIADRVLVDFEGRAYEIGPAEMP